MGGEETTEKPTSKYGDRNPSRSILTVEKEEDTEAKTQKAMKTTPGECGSSTEQAIREPETRNWHREEQPQRR